MKFIILSVILLSACSQNNVSKLACEKTTTVIRRGCAPTKAPMHPLAMEVSPIMTANTEFTCVMRDYVEEVCAD